MHPKLVRFPFQEPLDLVLPLLLVVRVRLHRPQPEANENRSGELVLRKEVQDLLGVIRIQQYSSGHTGLREVYCRQDNSVFNSFRTALPFGGPNYLELD